MIDLTDVKVEFVFDESNGYWTTTQEYNRMFLRAQQQYFNDVLHSTNNPLFLNDVLTALGFSRTKAGQMVGWTSDSVVDFGVKEETGFIVLTFNVDGPVVHLLKD